MMHTCVICKRKIKMSEHYGSVRFTPHVRRFYSCSECNAPGGAFDAWIDSKWEEIEKKRIEGPGDVAH